MMGELSRTLFFITIKCHVHQNSAGLCTEEHRLKQDFYVGCHWQVKSKYISLAKITVGRRL